MNIISGKTAVIERFKEEFDRLEEVGIGVNDRMLDGIAVEKSDDFREHLQLVDGG